MKQIEAGHHNSGLNNLPVRFPQCHKLLMLKCMLNDFDRTLY